MRVGIALQVRLPERNESNDRPQDNEGTERDDRCCNREGERHHCWDVGVSPVACEL